MTTFDVSDMFFKSNIDWADLEAEVELPTLSEQDNFMDARWFDPDATRATADRLLSDARPLSFLVRPSSKQGSYALSMKTREGQLLHAAIQNDEAGKYFIAGAPDHYATITDLVNSLDLLPMPNPERERQRTKLALLYSTLRCAAAINSTLTIWRLPKVTRLRTLPRNETPLPSPLACVKAKRDNTDAKAAPPLVRASTMALSVRQGARNGYMLLDGERCWCALLGAELYAWRDVQAVPAQSTNKAKRNVAVHTYTRLRLLPPDAPHRHALLLDGNVAPRNVAAVRLELQSGAECRAWLHVLAKHVQHGGAPERADATVEAQDVDARTDAKSSSGRVLRVPGASTDELLPREQHYEHCGALLKKGSKRWFVLRHGYLLWFGARGDTDAKGALSLLGTECVRADDEQLLRLQGGGGQHYELKAASAASAQQWAVALAAGRREAEAIAFRPARADAAQLLGAAQQCAKQGWLTKKGKRRYFVLRHDVLLWFLDECDGGADAAKCQGNVVLQHCAVFTLKELFDTRALDDRGGAEQQDDAHADDGSSTSKRSKLLSRPNTPAQCAKPHQYLLLCTPQQRTYTLQCASAEACHEWLSVLRTAIRLANAQHDPSSVYATVAARDASASVQEARAYVLRRGKRRYAVLHDAMLYFFESEADVRFDIDTASTPRASKSDVLTLGAGFSVSASAAGVVTIFTPQGTTECFTVVGGQNTEQTAAHFVAAIEHAIVTVARAALLQQRGGGGSVAAAHTEKHGWLLLNAKKRRWVLLRQRTLSWFSADKEEAQRRLLGSMTLHQCTLSDDGDSFSVENAEARRVTFAVEAQGQRERQAEQQEWVKAVRGAVQHADAERQHDYVVARRHRAPLLRLLRAEQFALLRTLMGAYNSDECVRQCLYLMITVQQHEALLEHTMRVELDESISVGTLFRGNSTTTKLVRELMNLVARPFVATVVGPHVRAIMAECDHTKLEVDPAKNGGGDAQVQADVRRLTHYCEALLDSLLSATDTLPRTVFVLMARVRRLVNEHFAEQYDKAAAGFLFLRFICPAIFSPTFFGITTAKPTAQAQRALVLTAKVLQNLANDVQFGKKEHFLVPLNSFITANRARIHQFFAELATRGDRYLAQQHEQQQQQQQQHTDMPKFSEQDTLKYLASVVKFLTANHALMEKRLEAHSDSFMATLAVWLEAAQLIGIETK